MIDNRKTFGGRGGLGPDALEPDVFPDQEVDIKKIKATQEGWTMKKLLRAVAALAAAAAAVGALALLLDRLRQTDR